MLRRVKISDAGHPTGIRAAAVAAALLGLVAVAGCGSSGSKTPDAASGTSTPSASTSVTAPTSLSSGDGAGGGGTASASTSQSAASSSASSAVKSPTAASSSSAAGKLADCTAAMLKVTVAPVREPINHLLITATNISKNRCRLNGYPGLRLDPEQQAPIPQVDATKPAGPIVIAPGAAAYAGLMTSAADGSGHNGKNEPTMEIQLITADGRSDPNASPIKLPMPKGANYVDDSAVVTYWVADQQTALY